MLPHLKVIKNGNKLSVFRENDSHCLSNFLHTHICWNFDHIFRIYNQINYRIIWFGKVIIILIITAQVLFFNAFSEKDPHLNAVGIWIALLSDPCAIYHATKSVIYKLDVSSQNCKFTFKSLITETELSVGWGRSRNQQNVRQPGNLKTEKCVHEPN